MISTWLMDSTSQPIGIKVLRHHSTGNQRYGYVGINNDPSNAPGAILIQDSFSDQSGSAGAAGRFYCGERSQSYIPEFDRHQPARQWTRPVLWR